MYPSESAERGSRIKIVVGLGLIALILAIVFFVVGAEVGDLFAPGPSAEVRGDISNDQIELTLASVERTDLLVATDGEGNVLQTPDGGPVAYRNAPERVGEVRTVDWGSLEGRELVIRARPPDADSGTSASPSTIEGWPAVDRIRLD